MDIYKSFNMFIYYNKLYGCTYLHVIFHPIPQNERWWYIIQLSPRSKPIFTNHYMETLLEDIQVQMRRFYTLEFDIGPTYEDSDEGESQTKPLIKT